jgi:dipeptidyl-peptidase-4
VFGWSYGGFMSLRLLSAGSDKIAAGVSARRSPTGRCTTPTTPSSSSAHAEAAPEAYKNSGVFAHLDGLKSPLLLVHGMADDNVLFTNTTRLIDALVNRGVQFDLMTYPGAKHGISRAPASAMCMDDRRVLPPPPDGRRGARTISVSARN